VISLADVPVRFTLGTVATEPDSFSTDTAETDAASAPMVPVDKEMRGGDVRGPVLILLHAFPLDRTVWSAVTDRLDAVLPVVAVNLPGFGATPLPSGPASLAASVDVVASALTASGRDRAVLAGVSMGGYVALAFAARYPDRVAGLALVDTRTEADPPRAREDRERMAQAVTGPAGTRALAPMARTLLGPSTRENRPDVLARLERMLREAPVDAVAWSQRAMAARDDTTAVLAGLEIPVAVVVGEQDVLSPVPVAVGLAATARDAVLTIIPESGHLTPMESPDQVADALISLMLRVRIR
jgi:pimeloyl-ACP methyl ester carboxylesterase